jgi:hypothetical protein
MIDDHRSVLHLFGGEDCCCPCGCDDPYHIPTSTSDAPQLDVLDAHPLSIGKKMRPIVLQGEDAPALIATPGDGVLLSSLPLVLSRDGVNPSVPLLPRSLPIWGPPYAPEASPLQEHPPQRLLGTASATPAGIEPVVRQEHMRTRDRDALMPYSAGIKNGQVYVRLFDLPAWGHFLRRNAGSNWPDDGVNIWAYDPDVPALYTANSQASVTQNYSQTDPASPYPNAATQQSINGHLLYFTKDIILDLARGPWRTVFGATTANVNAAVTRLYLNGTTEAEAVLPCVDMTINLPALSTTTLNTSYNYTGSTGTLNFGYQVNATLSRSASVPGVAFGSQALYGLWRVDHTAAAPSQQPTDRLMVETVFGRDFKAFVLPGVQSGSPSQYQISFNPATLARTLKLRYPKLASGDPTATPTPALTLAGRLVYEGPLGTLPAPYSGVTATWCGLSVSAVGAFTADAWTDRGSTWAVVIHASGLVQISRQGATGSPQIWTLSSSDLGTVTLPSGTPILGYGFLREGQGWPGTAGLLLWSGGQTLTARARRGPDPRDGTCPIVLRPGPSTALPTDPAISLIPGMISVPPSTTNQTPDPLPIWQAAAPGEAGGNRTQLVSVTGSLTLTFPDDSAGARAQIRRVVFLTSRGIAANIAAHLTPPSGWAVSTEPRPGRTALVILSPPILSALSVTLACTSLPIGSPRAHLETIPDV